jgi:hypothetical protein
MKHLAVAAVTVFVLSTNAFADSSTTAQKIDYARVQIQKLVAPGGYALSNDSINLRISKRPDLQLPTAFFSLLDTEGEIRVCEFTIVKDNVSYKGWTYLLSNRLGVIGANSENSTSVIVAGPGSTKTELYFLNGNWENANAPTIADLHLVPTK